MNEQINPEQILDRYQDTTPPELSAQELAAVQKHLADTCLEAIFGALPLQNNTRFTDNGFVNKETQHAKERMPYAIPGPYIIGGQYEPAGRMLYVKRPNSD